jgi:hypothetical protein
MSSRTSFFFCNVYSAAAVGLALSKYRFQPRRQSQVWDIIDPKDNFAGCRKLMAEKPCLPLSFLYRVELQKSKNAPDKIVEALQFMGYFGRKTEVEVEKNAVVREKADREFKSESWHGILWKRLLYNFCISSQ